MTEVYPKKPTSKAKRAEQLGMPYGTACNRLRKTVLFRCLVRLGENECFKCGLEIETVEELSIEHRVAWLDRSPDLFWDPENIAFSHLKCNRPDRPYHERFVPPEGMAWCCGCQDFIPVDRFGKNRKRYNGLSWFCRKCRSDGKLW